MVPIMWEDSRLVLIRDWRIRIFKNYIIEFGYNIHYLNNPFYLKLKGFEILYFNARVETKLELWNCVMKLIAISKIYNKCIFSELFPAVTQLFLHRNVPLPQLNAY